MRTLAGLPNAIQLRAVPPGLTEKDRIYRGPRRHMPKHSEISPKCPVHVDGLSCAQVIPVWSRQRHDAPPSESAADFKPWPGCQGSPKCPAHDGQFMESLEMKIATKLGLLFAGMIIVFVLLG